MIRVLVVCKLGAEIFCCGLMTTQPLLSPLLIDLSDNVWGLTKENARLRDSILEARGQLEHMLVPSAKAEAVQFRRMVVEKDT